MSKLPVNSSQCGVPAETALTGLPGASAPPEDGPSRRETGRPLPGSSRSLPVLPLPPAAAPPAQQAQPLPLPAVEASANPPPARTWTAWILGREVASALASGVFHAGLMIVLALLVAPKQPAGRGGPGLTVFTSALRDSEVPLEELVWEVQRPEVGRGLGAEGLADLMLQTPTVELGSHGPAAPPNPWAPDVGLALAQTPDWLAAAGLPVGGGLQGRTQPHRARLASEGGTPQSEQAVERGLRWLAAHQCDDGSWNFDLRRCLCRGMCRNSGTVTSTTAATALALAPFLGAGYTHQDGEHRDVVKRGLYYLLRRALVTPEGADLQEGTMYAQGLSAIVLCEAYAMTKDPALVDVARQALRFIVYAQDKRGGGWRYTPGEPGDTTVTGWQLMALKSGQLAGLDVPSPSLWLGQRFLDSVQSEDGSQYGYMTRQPRRTTTAIGLLCRMYLGWPRSHPGLRLGVQHLSHWGPSKDDMYYNYYATQVLRHWDGPEWQGWNPRLRDYLIATQATESHENGSWHFPGGYSEAGGRLYSTAMAVMILEVYYRYMPLYRAEAFSAD